MKGILLAGGQGTRLYPITRAVSKQLLPIYDKPMFYYPLATLMEAGIQDLLLISSTEDLPSFQTLLGDGSSLGMTISYAAQPFALGIADALRIGRDFIENERVALILGDNLFIPEFGFENAFYVCLQKAIKAKDAVIFSVPVDNPEEFGVVECDQNGKILSLEEKPAHARSNRAIPGLYFYPSDAARLADELTPSARGEIEITDLNRLYLNDNRLQCVPLPDSLHWLDTGTVSGLLSAINLVAKHAENGQSPGCIEEIAVRKGFISAAKFSILAGHLASSDYGQRLLAFSQEVSSDV